jgi:hypothetical protein
MRRIDVRWWLLAVFAVLLLPLATPAAAQLQTGDLYGTVVDQQGQALPGVTVTLTGIGSPQVQTTAADGEFRFLGLYPGSYKLTAELQGFSTLEYPDISIRLGGKSTIEVTLSSAVQDVITVTGEQPLLDERKVNQGANIPAADLDKIPTARDPWSLLSQAPGVLVDRFNLGGNESGQQSNFLGSGSGSRDNTFAVDGVILTDMNAVGASATYFDFGAFEEVQFTTSSTDVSIATSGVTVNQITKRGTNNWRGSGRYLLTDGNYQSSPRVLFTDPDTGATTIGNQIDNVKEYGADIGGPLVKDHLWIWASDGRTKVDNIVAGGQHDKTELKDFNSKLNFQLGSQNSGVLHYWTNDKLKFGRGAGPDRAPETTLDQTTPQDIYKVEDTYIPSPDFFLTGLWARDDGIFTLSPEGGLDHDMFRDAEGVLHGSNADFRQDAVIDQARLDTSYFFDAGATHNELKFGGSWRDQENHSISIWPRGKFVLAGGYLGLDDPDLAMVVFPRNRTVGIDSTYEAVWAQDTLTLDRWTVNLGLRYDRQRLENLPATEPGNPLAQGILPPLNFRGNSAGGFKWDTVVPRVGVTYALGQDRTTLLRGSFSQYAEQLGQLPLATRVNPIGYSYAYFYFTDANHNLVFDPSEVGSLEFAYTYNIDPDNPANLISPSINAKNLKPAMTDELSFGVEHALRADFAVNLNLTYRNVHDIPETRLLVVDETGATRVATRADWVVGSVLNEKLPNGQQSGPVPVYTLRDGLTSTGGKLYLNGDREQDYLGATLGFNKRMANRWSMRGNLTLADWKWKIGDNFKKYDDPTNVIADELGYADNDQVFAERSGGSKGDVLVGSKWAFNLNGLYQVAPERAWGFNIGGSIDGRQGYVSPPYARRSGPAGSRNVQLVSDIEKFRNPSVVVLNAHADKDFTFGDTRLTLSLDGFNLTNESTVLQHERNARTGNRAYSVKEVLSPRVLRVGATLRFR